MADPFDSLRSLRAGSELVERTSELTEYLPGSLREVATLLGLPTTLKLVEAFGGTRVWIPQDCPPLHPLVRALGRAAADRLCARYGLEFFAVPRAVVALRWLRDRDIRRRYNTATAAQLAREYELTERRIWAIVAAGARPAVSRQVALF